MDMSTQQSVACATGSTANLTAPMAAGRIVREAIAAAAPTTTASAATISGDRRCAAAAKMTPQTIIQAACAARPVTIGSGVTPSPAVTWLPSEAKGPDQSL